MKILQRLLITCMVSILLSLLSAGNTWSQLSVEPKRNPLGGTRDHHTPVKSNKRPLSELSVRVDTSIRSHFEKGLPPIDGVRETRPVAAIIDERGRIGHFVENELVLVTNDTATLAAFLRRWRGVLLATFDPLRYGLKGISQQHLVQIETRLADESRLRADLLRLDPNSRGALRVSSEGGMRLLAAGAAEAARGLTVGINWVGIHDSIGGGSTKEASEGPSGFNSAGGGYSEDAFDWNFLNSGSVQNIGVSEAWQFLSDTGRLSNRVRIAILDMGFTETPDLYPDYDVTSNVAFTEPMDTEHIGTCSNGTSCPWHGTNVAGAAMGIPDNEYGAAGPAGPVGHPVLVFTLGDYYTSTHALGKAYVLGARIMNMSYSAEVPATLSWSVIPFNLFTLWLSRSGVLLFASAGNDGANVDAEDCFIFCWEETWHTPCENDGVICVGGLRRNSKVKAEDSNWGPEEVDIFAPYTVLVGPDPTSAPGRAQLKNGTSYSSPYAAGVAALIWAANPRLSASAVKNIMFATAHESPDSRVNRYVNARGAVEAAFGTLVHIQSPVAGERRSRGTFFSFEAFAYSGGRGSAAIRWTSDRDGNIGSGESFSRRDLSIGVHTITATATFADSYIISDSVRIEVLNDAPRVSIDFPARNERFFQATAIDLGGNSADLNNVESRSRLTDAQVTWYVDGRRLANGHTATIPAGSLSLGRHQIVFEGTDGFLRARDTVWITILANPTNLPPAVQITSPAHSASFDADQHDAGGWYKTVHLSWTATDPEDGILPFSRLRWTTRIDGGREEALDVQVLRSRSGMVLGYRTKLYTRRPFGSVHEITLTATDSAGNVVRKRITVAVNILS